MRRLMLARFFEAGMETLELFGVTSPEQLGSTLPACGDPDKLRTLLYYTAFSSLSIACDGVWQHILTSSMSHLLCKWCNILILQ